VFRLPAADDPATLKIGQVASALADLDSTADVEVRMFADAQVLEVRNLGTSSAIVGSVKIDLLMTPGTIDSLTPHGSASVEFLCTAAGANPAPCSQRRANVIRFKPRTLVAGQTVTARLAINPGPARVIPVLIKMQTDNGQPYLLGRDVAVESGPKQ
jgi:hypothetical protein